MTVMIKEVPLITSNKTIQFHARKQVSQTQIA